MTRRDPLLEIGTLSTVHRLECTARRYSRRVLLNVLSLVSDPHPLVKAFSKRLEGCQRQVTMEHREMPSGVLRWVEIQPDEPDRGYERETYFKGCRHPLCPYCAWRWTWKEADRTWKKLTWIIEKPRRAHFTYFSVNIISGPLGEDYRPFREQFKKKLTKLLDRHLPGSLVAGGFHINLTDNRLGKLHFHGWVHNSELSRGNVAEVLRLAFPGLDELEVEGMKCGRTTEWHFKHALRYASDQHLMVKGLKSNTPQILHDWLVSLELLRGQGRKGLRMERGFTRGRNGKPAQSSTGHVRVQKGKGTRTLARNSSNSLTTKPQKSSTELMEVHGDNLGNSSTGLSEVCRVGDDQEGYASDPIMRTT